MAGFSDIIFAQATPPGKSGVAVIRISGDGAKERLQTLVGQITKPRYAYYRQIIGHDGHKLDDALVLWFEKGKSFTGEESAEIQCHGGRAVVNSILAELRNLLNMRDAEPGEFTRRALANGKMDLSQVEGLADLVEAETAAQQKQALKQKDGSLGKWAEDLRDALVQAMSYLALSIDFADEDIPTDVTSHVVQPLDNILEKVDEQLEKKAAEKLRTGFKVAIIGRPNAGKSTLLNYIAGREVAITTEIPGTTRDVLEVFIDLKGLPITFLDTAGLHESEDKVETIGINRARQVADDADLRIFLCDQSRDVSDFGVDVQSNDLICDAKGDENPDTNYPISGKTGQGVDRLLNDVHMHFSNRVASNAVITRERHRAELKSAHMSVMSAKSLLKNGEAAYDVSAEHIRLAVQSLDRLTGRIDVEDLLDQIFRDFVLVSDMMRALGRNVSRETI